MVIIFIGPPGSGKGTQAQVLKDTVLPNLHILTVSSLLKEKSSDGSVLGNEIKQKMDNGDLIEDTIVISVLKEKSDSLGDEQILVDGFPRSSVQAESLKEIFMIVKKERPLNSTILFSPCAASFDNFKNFEDRGLYFNKLVKMYENEL